MDFSKDDVCVLIPTLNEKATIGPVIEELQKEGYHHILVVDGHSTDGTPEIAKRLGATVMTQEGKGKGAVEYWVAVIKPGTVLFEIAGVPMSVAREAMRLADGKLPFQCRFVVREGVEVL